MKLTPLGDRVVLKQLEAETTTKSGIVLTTATQEKPQEAEVVAVGPGTEDVKMEVSVGQKVIYSKYAGTEVKTPFTLTNNQGIGILIVATAPVDMKITVYNSNGVAMDWADNPFYASASTDWHYDSGVGEYVFTAVLKAMNPGDYYFGITFSENTNYLLYIIQNNESAKINQSKAIITKGFTKKLSVTGAKVKSWKSRIRPEKSGWADIPVSKIAAQIPFPRQCFERVSSHQ